MLTNIIRSLLFSSIFYMGFCSPAVAGDQITWQLDPATIKAVMTPYIKIHDTLAKDSLDGIGENARAIIAVSQGKVALSEVVKEATTLSTAHDLVAARAAFVALSNSLIVLMEENHVTTYKQAYCPMVRESWLQNGDTVSNPFSADMATCGSMVDLGSHLDKDKR